MFRRFLCELRSLMATVRIGTRGSQLALWQANWVKAQLEKIHVNLTVELIIIKTKGDKILDVPLARVGGKGLFVKEIEDALLEARIDVAVHSMKDMPGDIPEGLVIGPIPHREDPRDVLIAREATGLPDLRTGARVGTSSLRRAAQIKHVRPDIEIVPLRGNLDTRLKKLGTEGIDAVVLAAAGLRRLGLEGRITQYLEPSVMLPAVAQGALCIEIRNDDKAISDLLGPLNHPETCTAICGERAFLNRLEGGCQVPIAAYGQIEAGRFTLTGLVAGLDGTPLYRKSLSGAASTPEKTGVALAETLLAMGAGPILETLNAKETLNR
jgi:hydroxymethylbilane synthase